MICDPPISSVSLPSSVTHNAKETACICSAESRAGQRMLAAWRTHKHTFTHVTNPMRNTYHPVGGLMSRGSVKGCEEIGVEKPEGQKPPGRSYQKSLCWIIHPLSLFQYISQYIMHIDIFQNAWTPGGAFGSMIYGSHIIYYLLVMIIPWGWWTMIFPWKILL